MKIDCTLMNAEEFGKPFENPIYIQNLTQPFIIMFKSFV